LAFIWDLRIVIWNFNQNIPSVLKFVPLVLDNLTIFYYIHPAESIQKIIFKIFLFDSKFIEKKNAYQRSNPRWKYQ